MSVLDEYAIASQEVRDACECLSGGEASEDDLEICRIISNMAVDVAKGNKGKAKLYIDQIAVDHPALIRLFSRVGLTIVKAANARKQ